MVVDRTSPIAHSTNPNAWADSQRRMEQEDTKDVVARLSERNIACRDAVQYLMALAGMDQQGGIDPVFAKPKITGPLSTSGLIEYIQGHKDYSSNAVFAQIVAKVQSGYRNLDRVIASMETDETEDGV